MRETSPTLCNACYINVVKERRLAGPQTACAASHKNFQFKVRSLIMSGNDFHQRFQSYLQKADDLSRLCRRTADVCGGGYALFFLLDYSHGRISCDISGAFLSAREDPVFMEDIRKYFINALNCLLETAGLQSGLHGWLTMDKDPLYAPAKLGSRRQITRKWNIHVQNSSELVGELVALNFPFVVFHVGPQAKTTAKCFPDCNLFSCEVWTRNITCNMTSITAQASIMACEPGFPQCAPPPRRGGAPKRRRLGLEGAGGEPPEHAMEPMSDAHDADVIEPGTLLWFGLHVSQDLHCLPIVPLTCCDGERSWAFPDVKMGANGLYVSSMPVRVTDFENQESSQKCTCSSFTAVGGCLHVDLLKQQRGGLWALSFPEPNKPIPLFTRAMLQDDNSKAKYIYMAGEFLDTSGRVRCLREGHGHSCAHVAAFSHYCGSQFSTGDLGDGIAVGEEGDVEVVVDAPDPVVQQDGREGLAYPMPAEFNEVVRDRAKIGFDDLSSLVPEIPEGSCKCGLPYQEGRCGVLNAKCTVYLEFPACGKVLPQYAWDCPNSNPGCRVLFDGVNIGLHRFSSDTVVSLRMLYKCIDHLLVGGTIEGYAAGISDWYERNKSIDGNALSFMSTTTWRRACAQFLARVSRFKRPEAAKPLFICPCCGADPEILVADGTALTITQRLYSGESITEVDDPQQAPVPQRHNRRDRAFLNDGRPDKERRVCAKGLVDLKDFCDKWGTYNSLTSLVFSEECLEACDHYRIKDFVQWVARVTQRMAEKEGGLHTRLSDLLRCLASDTSVVSYFPIPLVALLQPVLDAEVGERVVSAALIKDIVKLTPVLGLMLEAAAKVRGTTDLPIGAELFGLLDVCRQRALLVAGQEADGLGVGDDLPMLEAPSAATSAHLATGICSGLPRLRSRPPYAADKATGSDTACRHDFSKDNQRTGGIFSLFCPHGVCYAFFILPGAEGRNELFTFLTCYLKKAPRVIIYDFACGLQEYCLNRAPGFFAFTLFLVDGFHWPGHKSCATSFNIKLYDEHNHVNSVIAEQNNSALKRIKPSVTRMGMERFMAVVRLFLERWNMAKFDWLGKMQDGRIIANITRRPNLIV